MSKDPRITSNSDGHFEPAVERKASDTLDFLAEWEKGLPEAEPVERYGRRMYNLGLAHSSARKLTDSPDVKAIHERCEKATPGPWHVYANIKRLLGIFNRRDDCVIAVRSTLSREDADFIAHARTDIPMLLDALAAAQSEKAAERKRIAWAAYQVLGAIFGLKAPARIMEWFHSSATKETAPTHDELFPIGEDVKALAADAAAAYRAGLKAAGEVAREKCPTCEGTGLMGGECPQCDALGYRSSDCGLCGGKGSWEETCAQCEGKRVAPEYEAIAQAILALPVPEELGGEQ